VRARDFALHAGEASPSLVHAGETTFVQLTASYSAQFTDPVFFYLSDAPSGFSYALRSCYAAYGVIFFGGPPSSGCEAVVSVARTVVPGTYALAFTATSPGHPSQRSTTPLAVLAAKP